MNLVEFSKEIYGPLNSAQIQLLSTYEQAQKENKQLIVIPAMRSGKRMTCKIIDEWNFCKELTEHRCSCGRLLGKFNGQAEVKCPKCGKMNVIGVSDNVRDKVK